MLFAEVRVGPVDHRIRSIRAEGIDHQAKFRIFEVTEKAKLIDDFDTYEMSRRMGADVVLGSYFGYWKF